MSLHPDWIALILAVVAIAAISVAIVRQRGERRSWLRRLGIAVMFAVIAARPVVGAHTTPAQTSSLDVVLLIDRTTSMAAEDYNGNDTRLTGVRYDVREIVTQFVGARFVVITFDNTARLELPATTDTTAVATVVDAMGYMDSYYGAGSSISVALPEAERILDAMIDSDPQRQRMVVYLGDGEQTVADPPESFASLADKIDAAAVLGYGTPAGGRMKSDPDYDSYVWERGTGNDAISRIDEGNLEQIADDLGGTYYHRQTPDSLDLAGPRRTSSTVLGGEVTSGVDLTWIFGTVLVGLGLWELWSVAGRYRHLRRELS